MRINTKKVLAIMIGSVGLVLIGIVIVPILVYEWQSGLRYPSLLSPVANAGQSSFAFLGKDLTNSANWFEGQSGASVSDVGVSYYSITIPKLRIENAIVRTDSEDLSQSLTQFSGSARPGNPGNTVIFGHSVLPVFFNPKNYISIFSTLHKLNSGDEIFVNIEDEILEFRVETMFEVRPTDIEVLEQGVSIPYLSLITCSPPGDPRKPKRLVVRARIV